MQEILTREQQLAEFRDCLQATFTCPCHFCSNEYEVVFVEYHGATKDYCKAFYNKVFLETENLFNPETGWSWIKFSDAMLKALDSDSDYEGLACPTCTEKNKTGILYQEILEDLGFRAGQ